jgi:hypothetical protein
MEDTDKMHKLTRDRVVYPPTRQVESESNAYTREAFRGNNVEGVCAGPAIHLREKGKAKRTCAARQRVDGSTFL